MLLGEQVMLLLRTLHCNNSKKIRFIAESLNSKVLRKYMYKQVESGPEELIFILYLGSAVAQLGS